MLIHHASDVREFFQERIESSIARFSIHVSEHTRFYLVELMARGDALQGEASLVQRLAEAMGEEDRQQRFQRLRDTGDTALYTCGFFDGHLEERGLSRDYFAAMGGRAYEEASRLHVAHAPTLAELAYHFEPLSRVLGDVKEETVLRTPQDIVRLYDRWRKTQSPKIAERLHAAGVFPGVPKAGLH